MRIVFILLWGIAFVCLGMSLFCVITGMVFGFAHGHDAHKEVPMLAISIMPLLLIIVAPISGALGLMLGILQKLPGTRRAGQIGAEVQEKSTAPSIPIPPPK